MKRDSRFLIMAMVAGLVGVAIVLIITSRYGPGIYPDSTNYISAASSLHSGEGLIMVDGNPLVLWPPLFPALLAAIGLTGIDITEIARFVNAILFGFVVFLSGYWLLKTVKWFPLALFGLMAILLSGPLLTVSEYVMAEILFIVFLLLFFYFLLRFLDKGKQKALFLAAVFSAMACLTRYPGITTIITGLILVIFQRNMAIRSKLTNAVMFCVVAGLPLAAWLVRNYIVTSTLTGERGASGLTLVQGVRSAVSTISIFFLPEEVSGILRVSIVCLFFIIIGVLFVIAVRRNREDSHIAGVQYLKPLLLFCVIYFGFMIVSSWISNASPVNQRLASPAYVPIMLVLIIIVANITLLWKNRAWKPAANVLLVAVLFLWLIYPVRVLSLDFQRSFQDGVGFYATRTWRDSELVQYVKDYLLPGPTYSNDPYVIYFYTGIRTRESPRKYPFNTPGQTTNDLPELAKQVDWHGSVYMVWFGDIKRDCLFSLQELTATFDLEPLVRCSDGIVYRVR